MVIQYFPKGKAGLGNAVISSGSYTGNNTANRAIAHGLGVIPKLVVSASYGYEYSFIIQGLALTISLYPVRTINLYLGVSAMDATNFYVGNATDYGESVNASGGTYYWVAIG
jgi:hypothetical protein